MIARTEGADSPFWSPDSVHIGFMMDDKLKRVSASGGAPQTVCNAPGPRGGTWGPDGVIIFSSGAEGGRGALHRVQARGGTPTPVTQLDEENIEFSHRWPSFLPDGKHVLFARQIGEGDESTIDVVSLESGETTTVVRANSSVQYVPSGHLLYWREGSVISQPFDPASLEVTGDPVPIAEGVGYSNAEFAAFSASNEGTLVYHAGDAQQTRLAWFDRNGEMLEFFGEGVPGIFSMRLSNNGTRVVYELRGDVWVLDLTRKTETRLTFTGGNSGPVLSPDDEWIAFASSRAPSGVYRKKASGVGDAELLIKNEKLETTLPTDWSSDGRGILCDVFRGDTASDIALLDVTEGTLENLIRTPFMETQANLSPDGNWLAVSSNETGQMEIYLHQLSGSGGRWQVSAGGGGLPTWSRDGRSLYYIADKFTLMRVPIETGSTFQVGEPVELMTVPAYQGPSRKYDVNADGSRFLWNAQVGGASQVAPLTIVQNWPAMLP